MSAIVAFHRKPKDRRIKHVVDLIEMHPTLRSTELAARVRLTPPHLERLFKKEIGITVGVYSLEVRLVRAAHFLTNTYLSIKEIRNQTEISDASNFNHWFKERFGMSPTVYRNHFNARLDQ